MDGDTQGYVVSRLSQKPAHVLISVSHHHAPAIPFVPSMYNGGRASTSKRARPTTADSRELGERWPRRNRSASVALSVLLGEHGVPIFLRDFVSASFKPGNHGRWRHSSRCP